MTIHLTDGSKPNRFTEEQLQEAVQGGAGPYVSKPRLAASLVQALAERDDALAAAAEAARLAEEYLDDINSGDGLAAVKRDPLVCLDVVAVPDSEAEAA
jgi:hypothetical protein